jgi:hypothetical protein
MNLAKGIYLSSQNLILNILVTKRLVINPNIETPKCSKNRIKNTLYLPCKISKPLKMIRYIFIS